jgi:hypothetical protein
MIIGTKGTKVKIIFQRLYVTYCILMLVYNPKFCIFHTQFINVCWMTTYWSYIMYIIHLWPLAQKNEFNFFVKSTSSKFINFKAKNTFEPCAKCVVKMYFSNFNCFCSFSHQRKYHLQLWEGILHIWVKEKNIWKKGRIFH